MCDLNIMGTRIEASVSSFWNRGVTLTILTYKSLGVVNHANQHL
jgi:hypothetical protein